jgi:hypothetical protein
MSPLVGVSFELVAVEGGDPLSLAFFRTGWDGVARDFFTPGSLSLKAIAVIWGVGFAAKPLTHL